ncbi:hypothetical protein JCM17846_01400 [Iodidimonas nitroreducens]|uniref:Uncharacterized protein n=1 Tax=Iodidimonas nitroreducens TaxID=1236968 RepID=A0A5A7N2W2_9PROT|nr:hypothetical protein JCM17846_01400 [Iodidimonas nitroreducens]
MSASELFYSVFILVFQHPLIKGITNQGIGPERLRFALKGQKKIFGLISVESTQETVDNCGDKD